MEIRKVEEMLMIFWNNDHKKTGVNFLCKITENTFVTLHSNGWTNYCYMIFTRVCYGKTSGT